MSKNIYNYPAEIVLSKQIVFLWIFQQFKVTNMLHRAREVDQKVDVIRCMGNAGLPQFLPVLKEVIENKDEHTTTRTKAMYALRRIAPVMKSKVTYTANKILDSCLLFTCQHCCIGLKVRLDLMLLSTSTTPNLLLPRVFRSIRAVKIVSNCWLVKAWQNIRNISKHTTLQI